MTTAAELIKDAFLEIGKSDVNQTIRGEDFNTAIRKLNQIVASKPIIPNYTVVSSSSDEITAPEYSHLWLTIKLAQSLAPQYGRLESYSFLEEEAREAYTAILMANSRIKPPTLTGNVPLGSGNRCPGDSWEVYYTESDDGLLTETNENIVVEDGDG